jgi:hypothetical protein
VEPHDVVVDIAEQHTVLAVDDRELVAGQPVQHLALGAEDAPHGHQQAFHGK